ncbi:MAG: helix-turn-helix domain-containing protein [Bacteroidales bacterium]|nr:helix-turn-helix domain-containing protein [Bacteroidales bacterium]
MKNLGLIVPTDYKLLSIAAILDVFETTNRVSAENNQEIPFRIHVVRTPELIETEGALFHNYPVLSLQTDLKADIVLIPSFTTTDMSDTLLKNQKFIPWIRSQYLEGAEIASFCTGAFLFGASGLLDGKMATTHVDASSRFAASFPSVILKPNQVITVDGRFYTSGGSTSTFHLLLRIVQKYCGNEMAIRIAKIFAIDMDRYNQSYFGTFVPSHNHNDDLVKIVQDRIETKFREIETIEEIIKSIPSSRRNIVRRFKLATGVPPIEYLQNVRVESAKKQLEQSNHNINEIVEQSGYSDPKSFRKTFVKIVGMSPLEYRKKFKVA